MNKLIVLPGLMDSVFFLNEIKILRNYFDQIVVISYDGDNKNYTKIANKYDIKYYVVKPFNIINLIISKPLKILFSKESLKEVSLIFKSRKKIISKLLYMLHYQFFAIGALNFVQREIDDNSNICLYSFWLSRGAYLISQFNLSRKGNVKLIMSRAHRYDLYEYGNHLNYLPFRTFIFDNLDEINFISKDGMNYFESTYESSVKKSLSKLGTRKKKINIKKNTKERICIASCSAISKVKRLDLIIDVLSNFNVPFFWIHIGEGDLSDELKKYASDKINLSNFIFLNKVDNNKILDLYLEYDVDFLINMSDSEGIPVSIMEAISIGIPVIARNVGGVSEIVSNLNGLLLNDIDDKVKLYEIINTFVNQRLFNMDEYYKLKFNSVKVWESNFCADVNYSNFAKHILDSISM